jgi:hypothetical protein
MAKTIGLLFVVCVGILEPATARADDGSFWDMIWHWDLKLQGIGTEFHLLCLDEAGHRVSGCEEWFKNMGHNPLSRRQWSQIPHSFQSFEAIRHEINFRFSVLYSYGDRIDDAKLAPGDSTANDARVVGLNLQGLYNYRITNRFDVGVGGGAIPLFRLPNSVVWRPTATFAFVAGIRGPWYFRFATNYFGNTITASDLGHPTSTFSGGPEWGPSITIGYDWRRVGRYGVR